MTSLPETLPRLRVLAHERAKRALGFMLYNGECSAWDDLTERSQGIAIDYHAELLSDLTHPDSYDAWLRALAHHYALDRNECCPSWIEEAKVFRRNVHGFSLASISWITFHDSPLVARAVLKDPRRGFNRYVAVPGLADVPQFRTESRMLGLRAVILHAFSAPLPIPVGACCANERRSVAGGCLSCDAPSF